MTVRLEWCGHEFELLPERGMHWVAQRALLVADAHLGKAATFRNFGVPVPEQTTGAILARLDAMIARTRCERLIVLGDLLHAAAGRDEAMIEAVTQWRAQHAGLTIDLIRGNHDRRAGDPPASWHMAVREEPWTEAGLALCHDPNIEIGEPEDPGQPRVGGHIHPGIRMNGSEGSTLRTACFWFRERERVAVLPALGAFTGLAIVYPSKHDRVFAVGPGQVIEVGT